MTLPGDYVPEDTFSPVANQLIESPVNTIIVDGSATTEKSYQPTVPMRTGTDGHPGVLLSNLTDYSYIQSDDRNL